MQLPFTWGGLGHAKLRRGPDSPVEAFSIKLDVRELKVEILAGVWIWLRPRWGGGGGGRGCVCGESRASVPVSP